MTTTLAALQAGNARLEFVIAIDGWDHLISNAPQSLVQAAWASTDWASKTVIDGLTIELDNNQKLNPWNPFEGGGRLVFRVQPDAGDTFGIALARTDDGAETVLSETATRTSTLFVGFLDDFPATGEAHIGVECFSYGFVGGRRFQQALGSPLGSNRGKYVAHGVQNSTTTYGAVRFSEHHRVATQDNGVRLAPVISEQPRTWKGRRVSLWAHVYESDGSLNTKSDALCLFIGELTEPQDTETGHAEVLCEHLLSKIPKTTIGRETWQATVDYGMRLQTGQRFKFKDDNDTTTLTANDLVVVARDASGTNEVNAGQYGHEEISSIINAWLAGETAAGRIHGNYTFGSPEDVNGTPRSVMHYFIPGSATTPCWFRLDWPAQGWAHWFGFHNQVALVGQHSCGGSHREESLAQVKPFDFVGGDLNGTLRIAVQDQAGLFLNQRATMPAGAKALLNSSNIPGDSSTSYGLFVLECETPLVLLGTVQGNELRRVRVLTSSFGGDLGGHVALYQAKVPVGAGPPKLRQLFVHEAPLGLMMKWLFYSTGSPAYNSQSHDVLPYGQGLNIPYDALGTEFEHSCDAMPGADQIVTVVLDRPRTVSDLFRADLVMRNAHLVFREGKFRFVSWTTPSSAVVSTVLDESNKAEPIGTRISQKTASVLDSSFVKNLVKINYNRDLTKAIGGGEDVFLARPLVLEDATSVDDQGGIPTPVTLDLRNVFNDTDQVGQGVRALTAGLLSWLPWWSRPLWKIRRSIAPTLYEGFGVGDTPAVTDPHVREPTTGARGIVTRPGLVIGHRYQIQTAPAPAKIRFSGEVDIVFTHNERIFAYAPCADVDETKNDGGFTAGWDGSGGSGMTLQFKAHAHSESSEDVDVEHFVTGDRAKLIEVDPDDPDAADVFDLVVDVVDAPNNRIVFTAAISLFDINKRYRLVYDSYNDTQSSQRIKSFQAGENRTIGQSSPPDAYGAQSTSSTVGTPTLYDHTRLPELIATASYGPNVGAGRDCGYDKELSLLLDNMMDHQTRRSGPSLVVTTASSDSALSFDGWQILRVIPVFIGDLVYGALLQRYLWISPRWGSLATPNASVQLRVWLSGYPPTGDGFQNLDGAEPGYSIKAPAVSNSWSIWSNAAAANWITDTPKSFPLRTFNGHQYVFVIVEGTRYATFAGLSQSVESERHERIRLVVNSSNNWEEVP